MYYKHGIGVFRVGTVAMRRLVVSLLVVSTVVFMLLAWRNAQPVRCDREFYNSNGERICEINASKR